MNTEATGIPFAERFRVHGSGFGMDRGRELPNPGQRFVIRCLSFRAIMSFALLWHGSFGVAAPASAPETAPSGCGPPSVATRPSDDLSSVWALMSQAGQRLDAGKADVVTRQSQRQAVEILDRLIKQVEEQERQQRQGQCKACGGKGCRLCRRSTAAAVRRPNQPAKESTASPSQGGPGEQHSPATARPGETWGNMRPEERERILQSIGKDFPTQYRQLVEQYYKQLAKEE
ncbi:MAG TPA: hypothetical protein PLL20_06145 [Phycisphaerae bacterium]|nr:hypothetical protein [Phycisphaerae bacterium]HRR86253.1 hypothetical protein [Phycisphaerae bacterium]